MGKYLLALLLAAGSVSQPWPELSGLSELGCVVRGPSPTNKQYIVRLWVNYDPRKHPDEEHDWDLLYSMRPTRDKALQDCGWWMREMDKRRCVAAGKKLKKGVCK